MLRLRLGSIRLHRSRSVAFCFFKLRRVSKTLLTSIHRRRPGYIKHREQTRKSYEMGLRRLLLVFHRHSVPSSSIRSFEFSIDLYQPVLFLLDVERGRRSFAGFYQRLHTDPLFYITPASRSSSSRAVTDACLSCPWPDHSTSGYRLSRYSLF